MPRCYMVKKGAQRHDAPPPSSPTEASVAPPCYSPAADSAVTEGVAAEYAELGACGAPVEAGVGADGVAGAADGAPPPLPRSAADTEAAHELLSLAASLPPLPAAAVVTVLEPTPLLYTYTLQPANIYILADDASEPVYHAVQTVDPLPGPIDYNQLNYVTYTATPPPPPPEPDPEQVYCDLVVPSAPELEPPPEQVFELVQELVPEPVPEPVSEPVPEPIPEEPDHEIEQESEQDGEADVDSDVTTSSPPSKEKTAKYDCKECGKRYATSSNLSRHKQTHRSLDSVAAKRCDECGKAYVSMPALAMHVLTHRMGHVCGVCGKQFSRPWLLRGHLRSHTGEKPYSCAACGKAFADRSNLRAHLQTHSADKKHECTRCRKTFALKSYLNKHQESACVRDDADDV